MKDTSKIPMELDQIKLRRMIYEIILAGKENGNTSRNSFDEMVEGIRKIIEREAKKGAVRDH